MKKSQLVLIGTLVALAISASEYVPPLYDYLLSQRIKPTLNYPAYLDLRADRQARELHKVTENERRIRDQMRNMECLTAMKYDQILRDFDQEADEILRNIKK